MYLAQDHGGNGMNIEQAFIKHSEQEKVVEIVEERLNGKLKDEHFLVMEIPDSYDTILANDSKRKVAVSPSDNGWITVIESKEVNDYIMLISKKLNTEIVAIVQSDAVGAWGYVEIKNGQVNKSYFSEDDEDIENLMEQKLQEKSIANILYMFREVVRKKDSGWKIIQLQNSDT